MLLAEIKRYERQSEEGKEEQFDSMLAAEHEEKQMRLQKLVEVSFERLSLSVWPFMYLTYQIVSDRINQLESYINAEKKRRDQSKSGKQPLQFVLLILNGLGLLMLTC